MKNDYIKKIKLPDRPGVYFFLQGKEILYIGKATSLKDRVKSYFGKDLIETRGPIILDMVFKADKIKWETTDSVLEALILEANLIKKHQPKYNTKEKSDKSFNYVYITNEKLPRILVVRGRDLQKKQENFSVSSVNTFGPYPNSSQLKEALRIIRRIFPFVDETSGKKNNIEFYKQISLNPDTLEEYLRNIKYIKLFLRGKKKDVLRGLKKKMFDFAKVHEFEHADKIKKQIFALQHINDVALLKSAPETSPNFSPLRPSLGALGPRRDPRGQKIGGGFFRIEAYDIAHMGGKNMVGVMTVVQDGEIEKSEYKKFKIRTQNDANDTGALKEVLERRLNHPEWPYPSLVVVDGGLAQINATKAVLAKLKIKVPVASVVKDERHKPKAIMGDEKISSRHKREILLANGEAHRFAITYHKKMRNKNFLK